jgi:hypothetical protein
VIHGLVVGPAELNWTHSSSGGTEQKHVVTIWDDKWPCRALRGSSEPPRAVRAQAKLNVQLADSLRLLQVHKLSQGAHTATSQFAVKCVKLHSSLAVRTNHINNTAHRNRKTAAKDLHLFSYT